ncbi:protein kinase domain-containing protein [Aeromicrobium sp. CF3.5]|uniref:protein kinase domain-containing protein n=1 Tax=Aeromicrobium sp. CF3.5 TaxID=3373078 RepID=UPI003EE772DD
MERTLNDRYELQDQLGSGGMGEVWRAHDRRLDRSVAIKVMRHGPLADATSRSRMRSEALLAASIHHPGVAGVYDFDEAGPTGDGDSYIVMQLIEGHSLAEVLREKGAMASEQVMSILVQVASGLQAAHDAGIVHRDIKPANIMLTPAGKAVLVDFGLARTESSEPLTDTGTILGTAQYSSPEQSAGRSATPQSDLYSLGVVAHHCLTGTSPFRRDTPMATALAHLNDDIPPLSGEVPGPARDLIGSLTAKDPSARPSSAAAVAEAAAAIGADETIDLPPTLASTTAAPPPTSDGDTAVAAPVADDGTRRRRGPRILALVAAAIAVIALAVGGFMWLPADRATVPDVVGMSVDEAEAALRDAGMTARLESVDAAGVDAGDVVEQDPAGSATEPEDALVTLQVASGEVVVSADDLIGLSYAEAAALLEDLGLSAARTDVQRTTGAGQVVALDRAGRLAVGSTVTLAVAVAPPVVADSDDTVTPAPTPDEPTSEAPKEKPNPGNSGNSGNSGQGNSGQGNSGQGNSGKGNSGKG